MPRFDVVMLEPRHFAHVYSNSLLLHLTIHVACISLANVVNKNSPLLDPIKFILHVCFLLSFTTITSGYEGAHWGLLQFVIAPIRFQVSLQIVR